jgi:hypothetical protein
MTVSRLSVPIYKLICHCQAIMKQQKTDILMLLLGEHFNIKYNGKFRQMHIICE